MFNCFKKRDRGPSTTPDQIDEVVSQPNPKIKRIAIIPGHTARSWGMKTYNNQKEFQWNRKLVDILNEEIHPSGKQVFKYLRQEGSYSTAMKILAKQLQQDKIDLAIEFHLNAAGVPEARGCEMLIKSGADKTAKQAAFLIEGFSLQFDIVKRREYKGIRGIKALESNDRGSTFVYEAEKRGVMAMLFEPFFGDYQTEDSAQFLDEKDFGVRKMADFWIKMIKVL